MRNSNTFREERSKERWLFKSLIVGLALVCLVFPACANDLNQINSQYMREHWGSEKGFPGGSVTAIAQTADGYLWIGTEKGLIRFDGLNFRLFQQANPTTFPIGPVKALTADGRGNLWIVLQSTKILLYHNGKFELGRDEAEFGITSVNKRQDGTVILSSLALGTLTYEGGKFQLLTSPAEAPKSGANATSQTDDNLSSRLSWATGVTPHRFAEPNSAVTSMVETSDGKVWLGTLDKGLFYLKDGRISAITALTTGKKINCLLAIDDGELWIGSDEGVMRWDGKQVTRVGVPNGLEHIQILAMARDRESNIWIGTEKGLLRLNAEGVSPAIEEGSYAGTAVTALFEDREGNLWIGTARGVERFRKSTFTTYTAADGLPSESNGPVYVDEVGRTWFAPLDGGLYWLKGGRVGSVTDGGLGKDVIYSISGRANEVWVGRQRGGLTQLLFNGNTITTKTYTHLDGLVQDNVYAVHLSRDGSVWAGTLSGGVSQFKDGRFRSYTTADGMASDTVTSIAEGFDGTMWFATPGGLNALHDGRWRVYKAQDGLPSENLNCLFEDSAHVLWIGSAAGITFIRSSTIEVPRDVPDSLHEQILGIAENRDGWLWIATSGHVLRVNRENLLAGQITTSDIREYGLEDGLKGVEGVKRQQSVIADSLGRIWFSMNRGISVVEPNRVRGSAPALVKVEGVSADGTAIDIEQPIRIPSARQRITFNFAGLSLSVPERVKYRYRLDGFDRGWSEPVGTREAIYTNLSPGAYTFRVIASNSDGIWNENGPSLAFKIIPEFYQTKWFVLLIALAIGSIAWAAYRQHVGQVTARLDLQFKERLSERTRIARELHDTLLQSFQGLMLHFQTARNLLPGQPAEAIQRLDTALDGAEQAIVEGRNAIHDIRSSTLVNDDLAQAMTALGDELTANDRSGNAPTLNVLVEGSAKHLDPLVRDEIYRILREALRNAFSHAQAHNVEAEIAYGEKALRVRIRDDGGGIDPKVLNQGERAGHWGLPSMRERAKQIGGQLAVWSEIGAGTEVELSVPSSVVYRLSPAQAALQPFRKKSEKS